VILFARRYRMKYIILIGLLLTTMIIISGCIGGCGASKSVESVDQICAKEKTISDKEHCYQKYGKQYYNPLMCTKEKITAPERRAKCIQPIAETLGDPELCNDLSDEGEVNKETCIKAASKSKKNCGEPGDHCCASGCFDPELSTATTLTCDSSYICVRCGAEGEACCEGRCEGGMVCSNNICTY